MAAVIVYGPPGCGKTRHAQALKKHFDCDKIVDDWDPNRAGITRNALHLTSIPMLPEEALKLSREGIRTHSFGYAMWLAAVQEA